MVLFCINLDGSFVESACFVTWSIPTKVCGAIGYEITFLYLKAFRSYVNSRFFGLFILVLPLKNGDGNTTLPLV